MDDATNIISFAVSITTFLFVAYHYKIYRYTIIIPFFMAICSITYGMIPMWINNILYDITFIVISIMLVQSKIKTVDVCNTCAYKPTRKDLKW